MLKRDSKNMQGAAVVGKRKKRTKRKQIFTSTLVWEFPLKVSRKFQNVHNNWPYQSLDFASVILCSPNKLEYNAPFLWGFMFVGDLFQRVVRGGVRVITRSAKSPHTIENDHSHFFFSCILRRGTSRFVPLGLYWVN